MNNFFGEFECTMDEKGRIKVPAALVRKLPLDAERQVVLNRGIERCMVMRTLQEWYRITAQISKLNPYVKKNRDFQRFIYRGATELKLDNSSRLLLPKFLIQYAEIEKDVILSAHDFIVEIWNPDKFRVLLDSTNEPDDFSQLAEDVMGDKYIPDIE